MKALLLLGVGCALSACSFAARSPDMYRDDTGKALATKQEEIRACYDNVLKATPGAEGTVTVTFEVETEHGTISNVAVDKARTTAPEPVSSCVTKSIGGLAITPPDARKGQGMWVYEFRAPPPAAAPTPEKT
jgi:hypothetical protein